jgi:tRNA(fMet)-specific endonuclease VapC
VYLLDTTVWIDLLRTNSSAIRRKLSAHTKSTIGLSIITLCELQHGIEHHASRHPQLRERNEHLLSVMVAPFDVFPLDHRVVAPYGKVRAVLAKAQIGPFDTLIAAQALSLGATLVTSNSKEFRRVPGLIVEDWR